MVRHACGVVSIARAARAASLVWNEALGGIWASGETKQIRSHDNQALCHICNLIPSTSLSFPKLSLGGRVVPIPLFQTRLNFTTR